MATLAVNIKGLDKVLAKFGKSGQKEVSQDISDELQVAAQDLRSKAIDRATVDTGILRAGIEVDGKDLNWIVFTLAKYAGYVEFGTRNKVNIPPEMKEEALKFKDLDSGTWEDFKEAIKEWCKRKGIVPTQNGQVSVDPDKWDYEEMYFLIMNAIMKKGLEPRPFMYPSMQEVEKYLPGEIDKVIQRYLDK